MEKKTIVHEIPEDKKPIYGYSLTDFKTKFTEIAEILSTANTLARESGVALNISKIEIDPIIDSCQVGIHSGFDFVVNALQYETVDPIKPKLRTVKEPNGIYHYYKDLRYKNILFTSSYLWWEEV